MNNERMIAVSSDLIERAISLLDLLPESGTIIELRAALATQPAGGEPIGKVELFGINMTYVEWRDRKMPPLGTELYAAPPAAAYGHVPSVSGIGRDAGHPRALVLYLRSEPTDDDIRAIQEALRGNAAAHGDEAVRKDAERLDFILTKARKVVVEMLPRGRDVYVEEGVMGERTYPAIHRDKDWPAGSAEDFEIKRQAIDAAMRAQGDGEVQ